jgi:hypothetical protein
MNTQTELTREANQCLRLLEGTSSIYKKNIMSGGTIKYQCETAFNQLLSKEHTTLIQTMILDDQREDVRLQKLEEAYALSFQYICAYSKIVEEECHKAVNELNRRKKYWEEELERKHQLTEIETKQRPGELKRERDALKRIQTLPDELIRLIGSYAYTPRIRLLILDLKYDFSEVLQKAVLPNLDLAQMRNLYYLFKKGNKKTALVLDSGVSKKIYGDMHFGNQYRPMTSTDGKITTKKDFVDKIVSVLDRLKKLSAKTNRLHSQETHQIVNEGLLNTYILFAHKLKKYLPAPKPIVASPLVKAKKPVASKKRKSTAVIDLTDV